MIPVFPSILVSLWWNAQAMSGKGCRVELVQRIPDPHNRTVEWKRENTRRIPKTGVAIRKGQERAQDPGFTSMGTVSCDHCCQEFSISHPPKIPDPRRAAKQTKWQDFVLNN